MFSCHSRYLTLLVVLCFSIPAWTLPARTARYISSVGGCNFVVIREDYRSGSIYNFSLVFPSKPLLTLEFSLNEENFNDLFVTGNAYRLGKTDLYADKTMRKLSVGRSSPNAEIKKNFEIIELVLQKTKSEIHHVVFNLTDELFISTIQASFRQFKHPGKKNQDLSKANLFVADCSDFKLVK